MQKLFWKNKGGKVVSAVETPFKTEEEFESYIETAKEVLSDIFILKRQVRAGGDIPDNNQVSVIGQFDTDHDFSHLQIVPYLNKTRKSGQKLAERSSSLQFRRHRLFSSVR